MLVQNPTILFFVDTVLSLSTTTSQTQDIFDHGGLMPTLDNHSITSESVVLGPSTLPRETTVPTFGSSTLPRETTVPALGSSTLPRETIATYPVSIMIDTHRRTWNEAIHSCDTIDFGFCKNGGHSCIEQIPSSYDLSKLPPEFTAWVSSFLLYSYSIIFRECVEILNVMDMEYIKHQPGISSIEECVLKCTGSANSDFKHIGWMDGNCSCVYDALVHPISNAYTTLGYQECTTGDPNRIIMNIYQSFQHTDLSSRYCPSAAHLGAKNIFPAINNCKKKLDYYCKDTSELRTGTWDEAKQTCESIKSRIPFLKELNPPQDSFKEYWINGFIVNDLALGIDDFMEVTMSLQDFDARKCTALNRGKNGKINFKLLNCSTNLPSLCKRKKGSPETDNHDNVVTETAWKEERDGLSVTHETGENAPTVAPANITSESSITFTKSGTISQGVTYSANPQDIHPEHEDTSDNSSSEVRIYVAVGVTIGIIIIVVSVVLYRRCRIKKRKNVGPRKSYLLSAYGPIGLPCDNGHDTLQSQTRRYLPSVLSYPSDNDVDDKTDINRTERSAKVEQTSVTVHQHERNSADDTQSNETKETDDNGGCPLNPNNDEECVSNSNEDTKFNKTKETTANKDPVCQLDNNRDHTSSIVDVDMNTSNETHNLDGPNGNSEKVQEHMYPLTRISVHGGTHEENKDDVKEEVQSRFSYESNSSCHEDKKDKNLDDAVLHFEGSLSVTFQEGDLSDLRYLVNEGFDNGRGSKISTSSVHCDSPVEQVNCKSS